MKNRVLRRYVLFLLSLFINAFGIAFITRALLGTSPITSITYVLSLFTSPTMGQWTIIVNGLFVVFELLLMTRKCLREEWKLYLLQLPVTLFFGLFIDCSMSMLSWLEPSAYFFRLASLAVGCMVLAAGIALEVKMNVGMTAGEYFVRLIAMRFRKDFGYVKLGFDSSLVVLSCIVSFVFMSGIYGVREGTVVAALAVGPIVHFISPYLSFLDRWVAEPEKGEAAKAEASAHTVIAIAREYGSGGHLLGEMVAKELGINLYDKELIHLAAEKSGIDEQYIRENEQSLPAFWLKCISQDYGMPLDRSLSPDDVLFVAESKVIQEIAGRESCVIVGRCADYILKDAPSLIRVFCYADAGHARARCVDEYGIKAEEAEAVIRQTNKNRIAHYEYYTGEKWGDPHRYDLVVNTGCMSLPVACGLIKDVYRECEAKLKGSL